MGPYPSALCILHKFELGSPPEFERQSLLDKPHIIHPRRQSHLLVGVFLPFLKIPRQCTPSTIQELSRGVVQLANGGVADKDRPSESRCCALGFTGEVRFGHTRGGRLGEAGYVGVRPEWGVVASYSISLLLRRDENS